ncbi:Maf family protein [Rickettsiales bacterium]|nr:Maf family protein [Rickettsiales bacterium]
MNPIKNKLPIILASGSEVRKMLLEKAYIDFSVIVADIDEDKIRDENSDLELPQMALLLAKEKGKKVAKENKDSLIIAADQICQLGDEVLCKPGNYENAVKQLKSLSGKKHYQHSAVCVLKGEEVIWEHIETVELTLRNLTESEINAYVNYDKPYASCGSYKIEYLGKHLFSEVKGDHDAIMGLPIFALLKFLHENEFIYLS